MRKAKYFLIVLLVTALQASFSPNASRGFEGRTHQRISELATQSSNLNNFLTSVLGFEFPEGINEPLFNGKRPIELIRDGSVDEDSPFFRTRSHFHDPTRAWNQAGLKQMFESSILWSQNPNQGWGGKHSWQDARNSYFNALTSTDPAERKRLFAETFESLGHLIHLVQDAATPSHTRDDAHVGFFLGSGYGFPIGNPDRFHHWANIRGFGAIGGNQPFDPSIVQQTYSGLVPIAGIIDTTTAAGPATPSEGTNIGIAEFSNANFFSDDTILKDYAFPAASQMEMTQEAGPDGPEPRSYMRKSFGPGPIGYRAAVASRLSGFLPFGFATQQWELDDNVMSDYGARLFPRAIGYSAGLIDYFFRTALTANVFLDSCSGPCDTYPLPVATVPPEFFTDPFNYTAVPERAGTGRVVAVVRYVYGGQTHYFTLSDTAITFQFNAECGCDVAEVTISSASLAQVPEGGIVDPYWIVVYRGPLGQETDAVIAGIGFFWGPPL